jgi:hypothetical protein
LFNLLRRVLHAVPASLLSRMDYRPRTKP